MERTPALKTCPACGRSDYAFRSRKTLPADTAAGVVSMVETKYRCKACGHEWRVKTPAPETPGSR